MGRQHITSGLSDLRTWQGWTARVVTRRDARVQSNRLRRRGALSAAGALNSGGSAVSAAEKPHPSGSTSSTRCRGGGSWID
jgi:hypothetical protein